MNKVMEVLLTVVALVGLYCAVATNDLRSAHSAVRAQQAVVVADGSDPMPFCRGKNCTK
jgi:hypothetical protein